MTDPQEQVYLEFSSFDWESFTDFQEGLQEILTSHLESLQERDPSVKSIPPAERQQLTDQAKSFFFCSSTGHILNLDDYYVWKRNNGGKITLLTDEDGASVVEGTKPRDSINGPTSKPNKNSAEQNEPEEAVAPYSSNYQELVDLIVAGKPIPGIKEIPDTVLTEQRSSPQAHTRVKPWEKKS